MRLEDLVKQVRACRPSSAGKLEGAGLVV